MNNSMTRVQACALAVIAISMAAIAIAAPIVVKPSGGWCTKVAGRLMMLEALIAVVRRVLGL